MSHNDNKEKVTHIINEVLSDKEVEILSVFIAGLKAARIVKDYQDAPEKAKGEQSA